MRVAGNILWLIFGGLVVAIEYLVSSILLIISIIGIPFALQTLKLAELSLWPMGREIVLKPGNPNGLSTIMNLIWLLIGGIWIAITHVFFGILLTITIIGYPWGKQHFKLAGLALTPFGRDIGWK